MQLDDGALISGGNPIVVDGTFLSNVTTGTLLVSNTISGAGTLSVVNSGTLQLTGTTATSILPLNLTVNVGSGGLIGPQLSGTGAQTAMIAIGSSGTGALNVTGGMVTGTTFTVGMGTTGVGTVTISSGTMQPVGTVFVGGTSLFSILGNGGNGLLDISGGRVGGSLSNQLRVASALNSTGTIAMSGGSFGPEEVSFGADAWIGQTGTGVLTITGSTTFLNVSRLFLGDRAGSSGTMSLASGTAQLGSALYVGGTGGRGTFNMTGGSLQTRQGQFGSSGNAVATVTITGGTFAANGMGSTDQAGTITVGGTGAATGSLTIGSGAYVIATSTVSVGTNGTLALNQGATLQIGGKQGLANTPIQIATTGNTGSGPYGTLLGNLDYAGTLKFAQTGSSTHSGNLSGSGDLVKTGNGTVSLTGSNSFTGGTTLTAGFLELGSADALGTSGTISFATTGTGGALRATASNTTDYSPRFSQAANQQYRIDSNGQNLTLATSLTSIGGSFRKLGSGTITLTGTNSYSGGTTITAGSLVGSTDSLQGAITNSGAVFFDQASNGSYTGNISGTGSLTKLGGRTVVMTGSNSYSGTTSVSAGRLLVNGLLTSSTVSVASGATLGGSGSITRQVAVASGGTVAPGSSIESLATGAMTLASGATFGYEVDSTNLGALSTAADLLVVNGNLTLDASNASILSFVDLNGTPNPFVEATTVFAMINYTGNWNGGLLTYGGNVLADGEVLP